MSSCLILAIEEKIEIIRLETARKIPIRFQVQDLRRTEMNQFRVVQSTVTGIATIMQ
jgi:hypothetical protein